MRTVEELLSAEEHNGSWAIESLIISKLGNANYPNLLDLLITSSQLDTVDWKSKGEVGMKEIITSLAEGGKIGLYDEKTTTNIWIKVLVPIIRSHVKSNRFEQLSSVQQGIICTIVKAIYSQVLIAQSSDAESVCHIRLFSTLITSFEETYPGCSLCDSNGLSVLTLMLYSGSSLLKTDYCKAAEQWDMRIKFFENGVLSQILNVNSSMLDLSTYLNHMINVNGKYKTPALLSSLRIINLAAPPVVVSYFVKYASFILSSVQESSTVSEQVTYTCSSAIVEVFTNAIHSCGTAVLIPLEEVLFEAVLDATNQLPFLIAAEVFISIQKTATPNWITNHYKRLIKLLTGRTRSDKQEYETIIDRRVCYLIDICVSCLNNSTEELLPSWIDSWIPMLSTDYESVSSLISRFSDNYCAWLSQKEHSFWLETLKHAAEKSDLQTAAKLIRNVRIAPTKDWDSVYGAAQTGTMKCYCCCSQVTVDSNTPCQCRTVSVSQKSPLVPALQLLLRKARGIISSHERVNLPAALDVLGSVLGILKKTFNFAVIEAALSTCIEKVENDGFSRCSEMLLAMQRTALRVKFFSSNVAFSLLWDFCSKQTQSTSSPLSHLLLLRNSVRSNPSPVVGHSDVSDTDFTNDVLRPTLESYRSRLPTFPSFFINETQLIPNASVTLTLQRLKDVLLVCLCFYYSMFLFVLFCVQPIEYELPIN